MIPSIKTTGDKKHILNLYKHMICTDEKEDPGHSTKTTKTTDEPGAKTYKRKSTLTFVGLIKMDNAFLVAEAQDALIARYFSGRWTISAPLMKSIRDQEHVQRQAVLQGRIQQNYHGMPYPQDADYVNDLFAECLRAERPADMGIGKTPPFHTLHLHCVRSQLGNIRDALNRVATPGNEDVRYPTPEALAFEYSEPDMNSYLQAAIADMKKLAGLMDWERKEWSRGGGEWNDNRAVWVVNMERYKAGLEKSENTWREVKERRPADVNLGTITSSKGDLDMGCGVFIELNN